MTSKSSANYELLKELYLGFDLSTQQLKIIATNGKLDHLGTYNVEFDQEFGEKYEVKKGVRVNEQSGEIVSPVAMWLDAIDFLFGKMKQQNFPFDKVVGISGSGQQHGSVYWSLDAPQLLSNLDASTTLASQLKSAFTFPESPNWQDHSTGEEIKVFEDTVGGPEKLAELTGSRAHYRFTGLQIRKLAVRKNPELYRKTHRISLVSSFVASVLSGEITTIEQAEACGMNIYDIKKHDYDDELLSLAAGVHPKADSASEEEREKGIASLKEKLGEVKKVSYDNCGTISSYFVKKFGLNPSARIYPFTGDNLATIISLPLHPNDILLSLGTSTTVLLVTQNFKPSAQYHLFVHPTMPNHYMGMICYCNGALAREKVRDALNEKYSLEKNSWDKFNEVLDSSKKFDNKLGIYFPLGEIVPNASAQFKRSKLANGKIEDVESWDIDEDVSSIVESQSLSARLRAGPMLNGSDSSNSSTPELDESSSGESSKLKKMYHELHSEFGDLYTDGEKHTYGSLTSRPRNTFFVGGASNNLSIVRKMASILGAMDHNYKVEIPNACALGGAYKASWSHTCEKKNQWINYDDYISQNFHFDDLDPVQVKDEWESYFKGMGMLAKMEENLKHD